MKLIKVLFFSMTALLFSSEEIRIELSTKDAMVPIYLAPIQAKDQTVDKSYLAELEKILIFDFAHNGKTKLQASSSEHNQRLNLEKPAEKYERSYWAQQGMQHVITLYVANRAISTEVFSPYTGSVKRYKDLKLTGRLADDRRYLHILADKIHETLFKEEGIASSRILYALQTSRKVNGELVWDSEIWEADYDGANAFQVTKEKSYCINPTFYPPKKGLRAQKILYVNYKQGPPKIFITQLDHPAGEPFISLRGNQLLPTISRNGQKLAFVSDASGRADLFVQYIHPEKGCMGKPIQVYSFPNSVQASPTFNPQGTKLAFVSDKDGIPRIYVIDVARAEKKHVRPQAQAITKYYRENTCPAWSPDGKKLAYSAKVGTTRQIVMYDFETGVELPITTGPGNKENPCFAKNNRHIIYNSTVDNQSELFLINIDDKKSVKITNGAGSKHYPAWEP